MLPDQIAFSPLSRRLVEANFSGGHITSDAGLLLLREVDRQHRLTRQLAQIFPDRRDPERIQHPLPMLLAQRIYALAARSEERRVGTECRAWWRPRRSQRTPGGGDE